MTRKQFDATISAVRINMKNAKMEARLLNFKVDKMNRMIEEYKNNGTRND